MILWGVMYFTDWTHGLVSWTGLMCLEIAFKQ